MKSLMIAACLFFVASPAMALEVTLVEPDSSIVVVMTPVGNALQNRKRTLDTFAATPTIPDNYSFNFSTQLVGVRTFNVVTNTYSPLRTYPNTMSLRVFLAEGQWDVGP